MSYYVIRESSDTKKLGHYPQIKEIKHNCHVWDEPRFIEHHELVEIDFEPIISNAVLYSKTNLTDLISGGGMGFTKKLLVSEKLKKLLMNQSKIKLQFFESPLIQNSQYIYKYFILNVTNANMEYIDFKNSEIYLMDGLFDDIKRLNINNYDEFLKEIDFVEDTGWPLNLRIKKFEITENSSDFFALKYVEGGIMYVVSERLKQAIENAGCTGIEFQPSELNYNEWTAPGGEREKVYGKI